MPGKYHSKAGLDNCHQKVEQGTGSQVLLLLQLWISVTTLWRKISSEATLTWWPKICQEGKNSNLWLGWSKERKQCNATESGASSKWALTQTCTCTDNDLRQKWEGGTCFCHLLATKVTCQGLGNNFAATGTCHLLRMALGNHLAIIGTEVTCLKVILLSQFGNLQLADKRGHRSPHQESYIAHSPVVIVHKHAGDGPGRYGLLRWCKFSVCTFFWPLAIFYCLAVKFSLYLCTFGTWRKRKTAHSRAQSCWP